MEDGLLQLKAALEGLLDPVELSKHLALAAESQDSSNPCTALMHVRFRALHSAVCNRGCPEKTEWENL